MTDFLTVHGVSKQFGGVQAVADVSLTLDAGALAAIIGPNGAGKTTLFNLIAGAVRPTTGSVRFQGTTVTKPAVACRLGIGRTFQNVRLFKEMTVLENVLVGMENPSFLRASLRLPGLLRAERQQMRRAYAILEEIGLEALAATPAGSIPFGQQRLLEIGRTLARSPHLLLLDEPAAGLNRTETTALAGLIRRIRDRGIAILLVEHDMHMVMSLVEHVIVLDGGRKIAEGPPAAIRANPQVCEAYLGAALC